MATIYQVSELAGVSLATVSRVMNKNAPVSDKTREKVLSAMKELEYRPNTIAQSLASSRSNSVGILVSELHGHFYGSMLSGIENELRRAGKHVIIAAGHSKESEEIDGIEFLIDRSCDALILHVEAVSDQYLIELCKGPIPIILMNRFIAEVAENCVSLNNKQGGYLATKSLLEKGHRQLAYISGPMWKCDAQQRLEGHKQALAEYQQTQLETLFYQGDYQEEGGTSGMQHLLQHKESFTAVVCANDEMASGAMTVAREKGINIPEDLSFVGFDNIIFAAHLYPKLSTINYPIEQMGRSAARWILKRAYKIEQPDIDNIFEPEFISRDSIVAI